MSSSPSKLAVLKDRAAMLAKARVFFAERHVMELDCPCISASASVDAHIDLIPVLDAAHRHRYLHSSPEYGMKRLLAEGIGDCYQLSHVFRQGEQGTKHNPEFMMAEWYRIGFTFEQLIQEALDFTRLFLGSLPSETLTYREAFKRYAGFDYVQMTNEQLLDYLKKHCIEVYPEVIAEGRDAILNLILGIQIEPHLGQNQLCALAYYPSTQAALAQTRQIADEKVAERFEIYYNGIELANGYHELADAGEQRERLLQANKDRLHLGKSTLPLDENFLQALEKGLPDCCGVAVGFDRLMMLRHHTSSLSDVLPFDWNFA